MQGRIHLQGGTLRASRPTSHHNHDEENDREESICMAKPIVVVCSWVRSGLR
jgi:hypothetical protein